MRRWARWAPAVGRAEDLGKWWWVVVAKTILVSQHSPSSSEVQENIQSVICENINNVTPVYQWQYWIISYIQWILSLAESHIDCGNAWPNEVSNASTIFSAKTNWPMHYASWKEGCKVVNFDKLFPHSFVVLTPKKCEGVFFRERKIKKGMGKTPKTWKGCFCRSKLMSNDIIHVLRKHPLTANKLIQSLNSNVCYFSIIYWEDLSKTQPIRKWKWHFSLQWSWKWKKS